MNPYSLGNGTQIRTQQTRDPLSTLSLFVYIVFATTNALLVAPFTFIGLLSMLGGPVNWPNVAIILCLAAVFLFVLIRVRTSILHPRFAPWSYALFAHLVGGVLGAVGASVAMALLFSD